MKTHNIAVAALLILAGEAFAASTVSDVVARQRWPWSGKVDIDYTLSGDKADVDFYAVWDGQSTPVPIGSAFGVANGQHRFEFDPASAGLDGKTTTGFVVTASTADFAAHKYLVLDLVQGGYTYLPDVPEGGWTTEHKSTKMVFARIPAGTYDLGVTTEEMEYFKINMDPYTTWSRRTVTISSDYYVGVYVMTDAQYETVVNGASSGNYKPKMMTYYDYRGSTKAEDNVDKQVINWPTTRFRVDSGSFIAKLRAKAAGSLVIDLPEEEFYEVAVRAGTTTLYPSGGTTESTDEELKGFVSQLASWYHNGYTSTPQVGLQASNAWGVYDSLGCAGQWALDCGRTNTRKNFPYYSRGSQTDPVGFDNSTLSEYYIYRFGRSTGGTYASITCMNMIPAARFAYDPASASLALRPCIYLNPELNWTSN